MDGRTTSSVAGRAYTIFSAPGEFMRRKSRLPHFTVTICDFLTVVFTGYKVGGGVVRGGTMLEVVYVEL